MRFQKNLAAGIESRGLKLARLLTSPMRMIPDFLIIGAQKCGTTSLFNYLIQHPSIGPPVKKEIGFFSSNFKKGFLWYRSCFPLGSFQLNGQVFITGEATTNYICYPHAPRRIIEKLPNVKLILLLRNPVDRAYSHYKHTVRLGKEKLSFEAAINQEEERLAGYLERMVSDEYFYHPNYHYYTYLYRGLYAEQLTNWFAFANRENFLILNTEKMFENPSKTFNQVLDFLAIPKWEPAQYKRYNQRSEDQENMLELTTRKQLIDYFKPHNERLYKLLGITFDWDK